MENSYLDGYQDGTEGLGQGQQIEYTADPIEEPTASEEVEQPQQPQQPETNNLFQQAQDFVSENLLGRSAEESQSQREEGLASAQETQDVINADSNVAAEATRAVLGGTSQAAESALEFADLAGDTLKTFTGAAGETDNVFSDKYEQADYDFGVAENLTGVGKFGREAVSFLTLLRGAKAVPVLGSVGTKGGAAARIGGEALRGAVADLINSSDGGNLSNVIEEVAPALKDTWITSLAIDEDDNPWEARIKNVIEGGVLGVAVDGVGELYNAIRVGRRAKALGASEDEVIDAVIQEAKEPGSTIYHGTSLRRASSIANNGFTISKNQGDIGNLLGDGVYFAPDAKMAKDYGSQLLSGDASALNIKTLSPEEFEAVAKKYGGFDEYSFLKDSQAMVKEFGEEFDGVRVNEIGASASGRMGDEVVIFEPKKADELIAQSSPYEPRPNAAFREMEGKVHGANENKPSTYNSEERAYKETTYPAEQVIASQAKADDFSGILPVSAKPLLTDYAVGVITQGEEQLARVIAQNGSKIDVDKLSAELGQSNAETTAKALVSVRKFLGAVDDSPEQAMKAFDDITFKDADGVTIGSREAVVVTKTLIRDTSLQLSDIAAAAMDLAEGGADVVTRQVPMLTDRLSVLLKLHKTSAVHYAGGLQTFKIGPISIGGNKTSLSSALKDIDDKLTNLKQLAREGDPESLVEFKRLTNALVLSGGDASKQMDFLGMWAKYGSREMLTAMYNSMLSSPLSQVRNVFGSVSTAVLRPVSLGLGYTMQGNFTAAKASMGAFHSFGESIGEAFSVFGTSIRTGVPVNEGQKFITYTKEAAEELQLLKSTAATPIQKNAVGFLENYHAFMATPWFAWPTRTLTAVDDGFKTLVARMELKRGVFMESLDDASNGIKFNADRYAELAEAKFGKNGEILDKHLLATAKEATFQQDLQGAMKNISSLQQSSGVMQWFVPFLRTPHNIMVYAGTHTPFVGVFFDEFRAAMKSGDPEQQAVMLGRQAIGSMAAMQAVNMALNDNITGAGPVDKQKRKIWLKTHQPYSVKVAGRWVSYQAIEPINQIFAAAADLTQLAAAGATSSYDKSVAQFAFTIAAATYDKSYYTGLADVLSLFNPRELVKGETFAKFGMDGINRLIPLQGARRQLSRALSPGIYEWRGELDKQLASAIPGYARFNSVPRIDIFTGEQMLGTMGNPINSLLPFSVTDKKDDPVINRLGELGVDVSIEFSDRLRGMEIDPAESQAINKLMAEEGVHSKLKSLFDKKWFNEDVAQWEGEKISNPSQVVNAIDSRWYEATINVFSSARDRAVNRYMANNPDFRARVNDNKAARRRAGRGQYNPVSDLVDFAQ